MSERAETLGRRVELRQQRARLVAECEALRDSMRRLLPLEEEVSALEQEKILTTAVALNQSLLELAETNKKLHVLNRVLGE